MSIPLPAAAGPGLPCVTVAKVIDTPSVPSTTQIGRRAVMHRTERQALWAAVAGSCSRRRSATDPVLPLALNSLAEQRIDERQHMNIRSGGAARARRVLAAGLAGLGMAGLALTSTASPAQAATAVRVESQITAHNLPYLGSSYIADTVLSAGEVAYIDCQVTGREPIAGSYTWYRIGWKYYPSYAFSGTPTHPACGVTKTVPSAANGWSTPSFDSTPASGLFASGDSIKALCWAAGDTVDGSNVWFFARGYWVHSSRLQSGASRDGMTTCAGFVGDDYPVDPNASSDPWYFSAGQCTSFAAYRVNLRKDPSFSNDYRNQHFGHAEHWDDAARAAGLPVTTTPAVNTVAQTDVGENGHVAWVVAVNSDGTVTIEDYNHDGTERYSARRVPSSAYRYIHFPQR